MINDIQAIPDYANLTPTQIADALKAKGVTVSSINRADLMHLLNIRGMLRKLISNDASEKWEGTVYNMQTVIFAMGTQDQVDGIKLWFSHVTNQSNNTWDTTTEEFAAPFWQMFQTFADLSIELGSGPLTMPSTADFDAIVEMGGGWKYATVTAVEVTAALDAETARLAEIADKAARKAIVDGAINSVQVLLTDASTRFNNAQASLGEEYTAGMTLVELQAYADSVVASPDGLVGGV